MYIINEAKMLLTEDQEGDSIKKAIILYMDIMGCSKEEANKFIREDLREKFPNLRYKKEGKFILGTTRMFLNRQFVNDNIRQVFNATLPYVASDANYQKYDKNLNGLSADEIIERFREERERDAAADREKLANQEYEKNTLYDIVRIDTFEESSQYAQYCYQNDVWCITKYPHMLDHYTDGGIGQFYFCLKKGFENIEPIQGEGCPLDEYGLSMIAVCVNGDGSLKNCTCRWNHSNGGNDNVMNTEQVSNVLGVNFYDVFKPNGGLEELIRNKIQLFKNGADVDDVFGYAFKMEDNICKIVIKNLINYVNLETREVLSDVWFNDGSISIKSNFIWVKYNDKELYLNVTDGKLYEKNEAFHYVGKRVLDLLKSGKTVEELKNEKVIDACYKAWGMINAYHVRCNGKYNIIMDGNRLLFDEWYDDITDIKLESDIYYRIKNDKRYVLLNDKKENVLGKDYKYIGAVFMQGGHIEIVDEEGANVININNPNVKLCKKSAEQHMSLLCYAEKPEDMLFSCEELDGLHYIYDANGNRKVAEGFHVLQYYAYSNIILCKKHDQYSVVFTNNYDMSDWYDKISNFYFNEYDPYLFVNKNDKIGCLNGFTHEVLPYWFTKIDDIGLNRYIVYNEENLCNLFEKGILALKEWVSKIEKVSSYSDDFYITNTDGKKNLLVYSGMTNSHDYVFEKWYDNVYYDRNTYEVTVTENGNTFSCYIWDVKRNNL